MTFEVVLACALVLLHGVVSVGSDVVSVSVKEGAPVTLHHDIKITQEDTIRWYCNGICIAKIDLYYRTTCTDVQCNEGTERFRDRLKLDHQTGSLTIMNTISTDSGEYTLKSIRIGSDNEAVYVVSVSVKPEMEKDPEGQSDTSDPETERPLLLPLYPYLPEQRPPRKQNGRHWVVTVTLTTGSGVSAGAIAAICVSVTLLLVCIAVALNNRVRKQHKH